MDIGRPLMLAFGPGGAPRDEVLLDLLTGGGGGGVGDLAGFWFSVFSVVAGVDGRFRVD